MSKKQFYVLLTVVFIQLVTVALFSMPKIEDEFVSRLFWGAVPLIILAVWGLVLEFSKKDK